MEFNASRDLYNKKERVYVKSVSSILLGISAGVLGLENEFGVIYYVLGMAGVGLAMALLSCHGRPENYISGWGKVDQAGVMPWLGLMLEGMLDHLLSYILFWAAAYSLAHGEPDVERELINCTVYE